MKQKSAEGRSKGSKAAGSGLVAKPDQQSSVQIAIRLPAADLAKAREIADLRGIGYQTLLKMLIREGLVREARRGRIFQELPLKIPTKAPAAAERQLDSFINKFDPKHAALIRSLRKAMRKRLPTANELVWDNYNFFVIAYSATERPSDSIVSIAAAANGVGLAFYYGAKLPDPHKLLLGSGTQNRFIRLESAATLERPEVKELIAAAIAQAKTPLPAKGGRELIIRSISAKQRPRRKRAK